jgi:ABC-type Na+ transport system ATPase subunit NatA
MKRPESGIYQRVRLADGGWESVLIEHLTREQLEFALSDRDQEWILANFGIYHKFVSEELLPYVARLEEVQDKVKSTVEKIEGRLNVLGAFNREIEDAKKR